MGTTVAGKTPHYIIVRLVLILVSYSSCTEKALVRFSRFRLGAIVEARAKVAGWAALKGVISRSGKSTTLNEAGGQPDVCEDMGEASIMIDGMSQIVRAESLPNLGSSSSKNVVLERSS